jgi:hypothetical protein
MSQRTSKKPVSTDENILYALIDDDHIKCVPADPILKSLSVKNMNTNSL